MYYPDFEWSAGPLENFDNVFDVMRGYGPTGNRIVKS